MPTRLAFLLVATLLLPATARADVPPPPPPSPPATRPAPEPLPGRIAVQLTQKAPLRLVRFHFDRKDPGQVALDGALEVAIDNVDPAKRWLHVPRNEVHGFVFRPKGGGAPFVLLHSCRCVKDYEDARAETTVLEPGRRETVLFDDWGCAGSMWTPPPEGTYTVTYRAFAYHEAPPPPAKPKPDAGIPALIEDCRKRFADDATWQGATVSNPLEVTLTAPVDLRYDAKRERWVEQKPRKKAKVR